MFVSQEFSYQIATYIQKSRNFLPILYSTQRFYIYYTYYSWSRPVRGTVVHRRWAAVAAVGAAVRLVAAVKFRIHLHYTHTQDLPFVSTAKNCCAVCSSKVFNAKTATTMRTRSVSRMCPKIAPGKMM